MRVVYITTADNYDVKTLDKTTTSYYQISRFVKR